MHGPTYLPTYLQPQAFPRLLAAAASAVTSFCDPEKCNARALGDQLDPLLRALFHLLGTADTFVKEEAMTAVAVLAQVSEAKLCSLLS